MPVHAKEKAQAQLVLDNLEGAAAYPALEHWDHDDVHEVDYLYRQGTILALEQDAERVDDEIRKIFKAPKNSQRILSHRVRGTGRVFRFTVDSREKSVPDILNELDRELGGGVATPDIVVYLCPNICAATEPLVVPRDTEPVPPPGLNGRGCRPCRGVPRPECDGHGAVIAIVDTGLTDGADAGHPWLVGVRGTPDPLTQVSGVTTIPYDAGHGTFVAGVARCMAPRAEVYVERAFYYVGANFETDVQPSLQDALSRNPDILQFTFCATTRDDWPLKTFDDFFDTHLRYHKGLVVLAPAGNDGKRRPTWPAAYREVISVGALSATWRDRAQFSNYGKWVDVFAPGEDLINAFPSGTYTCVEPPFDGDSRVFDGMAEWSGTSFSTPVVAGLIAARMSATGENAPQAADALLRLAASQAVPGVGAVLYPGQACCAGDCCQR
jgi:Subtilase family